MLLLLIALSALLSYVAVDWKAFFHIKDGGSWTHPLFYSLIFLVGLPLAKIGWGRFGLVAYGSAAFAFFALPNGPYYYQSGSNMFQSFVRAAALVGLVAILKRGSVRDLARQALSLPGRRLAAAILVIFTPWLFAQDAGGWVWQSYSEKYMRELLGLAPTVAIYYIMGALLIWALPDRARRIKFGLLWVFSHAYVVGVAEVTTVNFVSSQMPIMVLLGWFLWRKQRTDAEGDGEDPLGELGALVVMAAICTNLWFILRGFTVANADWGFCYTYLGWARHDAVFFGLALVLCIPKYGMGLMTALVFISMLSTPCRVSRLFDRLLLLTMFKMAFYFIQVLFGSIRAGEKLHELAVGGVIYLSLFIPMVGGLYLLLWSFHKIRTKLNP